MSRQRLGVHEPKRRAIAPCWCSGYGGNSALPRVRADGANTVKFHQWITGPALAGARAAAASWARLLLMSSLAACTSCSNDEPESRCSGFEQCGGDVEGAWSIKRSCVEGNLTALANLNPQLPVDCQGMYHSVNGDMSGTVTFAAGTATIDTMMTIEFRTRMDGRCAAANGVPVLDQANCAEFGSEMVPVVVEGQPHSQIACVLEGDSCNCAATDRILTQETREYTISGSSIHYTGSKWPLDFCVNGSVLRGRQFDSTLISTIFIDASR